MKSRSILVKVPATVGNFAGAMDCAALALDALLNVKVTPRADGQVSLRYFGENGDRVPRNRGNLLVSAMEAALGRKGLQFTGADFEIYSSIPVAVGLGSSTAAVLAGLIAADRLYSLGLKEETLFDLAGAYEPRRDNLLAAWHGGFVACLAGQPSALASRALVSGDYYLSVVAPEPSAGFPVRPEKMTPAMPSDLHALNAQRAQTLADFFSRTGKGNSPKLDATLPPAPRKVVAGSGEAIKVSGSDILGVFICGSGPGVGILTRKYSPQAIAAVRKSFLDAGIPSTYGTFRPSNTGAREWNAFTPRFFPPSIRRGEVPVKNFSA